MKKITYLIAALLIFSSVVAQNKVSTDSHLQVAIKDLNAKKYDDAKSKAKLGIQLSPEYLDFHFVLAQSYRFTQMVDSARFYYTAIIKKNTNYTDAYIALSQMEMQLHKPKNAALIIEQGIQYHPQKKELLLLKLSLMDSIDNETNTMEYLKTLINKYSDDKKLTERLAILKKGNLQNTINASYNLSTFNRNGIGPWHLYHLGYTYDLKKGSISAKINYTNREYGTSKIDATFYEIDFYQKLNKKSYIYLNAGVGQKSLFPKLRLNASYYRTLSKGWIGELGLRYFKNSSTQKYSGALGIEYYFGSQWINFRTLIQENDNKIYTSFAANYRYYTNTKYDYWSITAGYGLSPDDRDVYSLVQTQNTLQSYRLSTGYNHLFSKKIAVGLGISARREEYSFRKFQTEMNYNLSLQYLL